MIEAVATSLKAALNKSDPNAHADILRILKFGNILAALPTQLHGKVPAAAAGLQLATLAVFKLPEEAKAGVLHRVYAYTAGTGAELTIVGYGVTPATGQAAIAPNGDIVTLAADAYTKLDIFYTPDKSDIVELSAAVATNALAIPAAYAGRVKHLVEATATVGGATGVKIALVPGAAPAAGQSRLDVLKANVLFAGADAVTYATVKLALAPAVDAQATLLATSIVG